MKYNFFKSREEMIPEPVIDVLMELDSESGLGIQIYLNNVAVLTLRPNKEGKLQFFRNNISRSELPYLAKIPSAKVGYDHVVDIL